MKQCYSFIEPALINHFLCLFLLVLFFVLAQVKVSGIHLVLVRTRRAFYFLHYRIQQSFGF